MRFDTEVMLAIIRKRLDAGLSVPAAIAGADGESKARPPWRCCSRNIHALALATNNGSLYTLTNSLDLLLFASEEYPLKVVAKAHGLTCRRSDFSNLSAGAAQFSGSTPSSSRHFDYCDARRSIREPWSIAGGCRSRYAGSGTIAPDELVLDVAFNRARAGGRAKRKAVEFNGRASLGVAAVCDNLERILFDAKSSKSRLFVSVYKEPLFVASASAWMSSNSIAMEAVPSISPISSGDGRRN